MHIRILGILKVHNPTGLFLGGCEDKAVCLRQRVHIFLMRSVGGAPSLTVYRDCGNPGTRINRYFTADESPEKVNLSSNLDNHYSPLLTLSSTRMRTLVWTK